jgi:preprotein translocase SecE subunit
VARETRAQRRAARAQQGGAPPRRPDRPTGNGGIEGRPDASPAPQRESKSRFGFVNFVRESWAELKKVEWPGQSQVIQATIVVLIACIVVGAYLYANDQLWQPVVKRLVGQ